VQEATRLLRPDYGLLNADCWMLNAEWYFTAQRCNPKSRAQDRVDRKLADEMAILREFYDLAG
jgi:hypothetical protein